MAAVVCSLVFAACGGGGGGGGGGTVTPPQVFANTALPFYLPLATGNTWNFATGSKIVDGGSRTLSCTCTFNGRRVDHLDLIDPSGVYGSSFIFSKFVDNSNGGVLTSVLVGTSTDHGATVSIFGNATNTGVSVMNDAPVQGQVYTNSAAAITTTISPVGQTQSLPDGRFIRNVATATLTSPGAQNIVFGLAQGVGFTSVGVGSQSSNVTSFTVDTVSSASAARSAQSAQSVAAAKFVDPASMAPLLSKLF